MPVGEKVVHSPGSFTGYGFDRCITPSNADMDTWRRSSPFAAVGIYISGAGRACPARSQPYLSPRWVNLHRSGYVSGAITERFDRRMARGVRRIQRERHFPVSGVLTHRTWVSLLATGGRSLVKVGSDEQAVWRLQRALVAAGVRTPVTGVFTRKTAAAAKVWQRHVGEPRSGVIDRSQWRMFYRGRR